MVDKNTIAFVPTRLNRAAIVFRGMTGREVGLMAIAGLSTGLVLGLVSWFIVPYIAMVPTVMFAVTGLTLWFGGTLMRRLRRGRPETWLYRRIQWRLAHHGFNKAGLILDTATYRVRRDQAHHTGERR